MSDKANTDLDVTVLLLVLTGCLGLEDPTRSAHCFAYMCVLRLTALGFFIIYYRCVRACVRVCVRACVRACARVCVVFRLCPKTCKLIRARRANLQQYMIEYIRFGRMKKCHYFGQLHVSHVFILSTCIHCIA